MLQTIVAKYWKPTSLTWWGGVAMALSGVVLAVAGSIPALAPVSALIAQAYPGMGAWMLINGGLVAIGIRGAMTS